MSEKALIIYEQDDGTVREIVARAEPHEGFFGRELNTLSGPHSRVHCVYASQDLERAIRKAANASGMPSAVEMCSRIRGLGDLSLERGAALHAKLEI